MPDLVGLYRSLFRHDEWNIGVISEHISAFLEPHHAPRILWFPPHEQGKYLADPFPMCKDDKLYVLCEEFDYSTFKGRIVSVEVRQTPVMELGVQVAIELPIHMSYPYLLKHNGEIFCVPETAMAKRVSIYRAEDFPTRWEKAATLLDGFPAVDSSLFQYEGRWWLTCTSDDQGWSKLFVWYSDELFGPWRAHAANPVKTNIHSSRPAGTPFVYENTLFRPAQDCSITYGGMVVINRVTKLTPTEFGEEEAAFVGPDISAPYSNGLHTLSASGNYTLVDAKKLRFNVNGFKKGFATNLRKASNSIRASKWIP
jgi:hypothetical protein